MPLLRLVLAIARFLLGQALVDGPSHRTLQLEAAIDEAEASTRRDPCPACGGSGQAIDIRELPR